MIIPTRAVKAMLGICLIVSLAGCADDSDSQAQEPAGGDAWEESDETVKPSPRASPKPSARPSARGKRSPAPSTSPPKPEPKPVISDAEISDQAFLLQLADSAPSFTSYPDDQLTSLGRAICGDLGDGYDPYALSFQLAGELGADEVESAGFVGAAMGSYCPQHSDGW